MKLAFVVQRYGEEVLGGAEGLARQVAELLAPTCAIDILTTCAIDYTTWANHYPAGPHRVNGLPVRRFPVAQTRHPHFQAIHETLLRNQHATIMDELHWLREQGPNTPQLLGYLARHWAEYDLLIFVGYLYFHSYFGLQIAPQRSVLIPTTHDEPPLRFSIYNTVFSLPRGLIFMTPEEQAIALSHFPIRQTAQTVIGGQVPLPELAEVTAQVDAFRQKYELRRPYVLYAGRIDQGKHCHVLLRWFDRFRRERAAEVELVLIGSRAMDLPPWVRYLGRLSEAEKFQAMAGAAVFAMPSPLESFSIVSLEAMGMGTPLLANAASDVVRGHCVRANGGLYYHTYAEFAESLALLLQQPALAHRLGQQGRAYVQANYAGPVVRQRYLDFLGHLLSQTQELGGRPAPPIDR